MSTANTLADKNRWIKKAAMTRGFFALLAN
jgi:hypothetical protein